MLVVDASVAVKWFVREAGHERYLHASRGGSLAAPDRLLLEVANVLRRKVRQGEILAEQARLALRRLPSLIGTIVPSADLLLDAFGLAERLDHSVYDCAYLACARRLNAPLLTADDRFAAKAKAGGFAQYLLAIP